MAFIAHPSPQKRRTESIGTESETRPSPPPVSRVHMYVGNMRESSHEEKRRRTGEPPPNVVEVEREGTLASDSVDECRETMCREEATFP